MNAAVFLDRDNTIIHNDGDLGDPAKVRLIQGAASAVASLKGLGYKIIVVTNQGGVARGKFTEQDVDAVHERINELVRANSGAAIDRFYYCPYHPEGRQPKYRREHPWRKPKPGMLLQAGKDLNLSMQHSWMVGDQMRDVQAGYTAGVTPILLLRDPSRTPAAMQAVPPKQQGEQRTHTGRTVTIEPSRDYFVARSLIEAVRLIGQQRRPDSMTQARKSGRIEVQSQPRRVLRQLLSEDDEDGDAENGEASEREATATTVVETAADETVDDVDDVADVEGVADVNDVDAPARDDAALEDERDDEAFADAGHADVDAVRSKADTDTARSQADAETKFAVEGDDSPAAAPTIENEHGGDPDAEPSQKPDQDANTNTTPEKPRRLVKRRRRKRTAPHAPDRRRTPTTPVEDEEQNVAADDDAASDDSAGDAGDKDEDEGEDVALPASSHAAPLDEAEPLDEPRRNEPTGDEPPGNRPTGDQPSRQGEPSTHPRTVAAHPADPNPAAAAPTESQSVTPPNDRGGNEPSSDSPPPHSPINADHTLRQILQELRNQRDVGGEFSGIGVAAIVLQAVAFICLLAGLLMGAGNDAIFLRCFAAGIVLQLATIAILLFRK